MGKSVMTNKRELPDIFMYRSRPKRKFKRLRRSGLIGHKSGLPCTSKSRTRKLRRHQRLKRECQCLRMTTF
jgi:hypothetical protein